MLETVLSVYMRCKGIWIPNRLHTTIHADEIVTELIVSSTMYTGESNAAKKKSWEKGGEV